MESKEKINLEMAAVDPALFLAWLLPKMAASSSFLFWAVATPKRQTHHINSASPIVLVRSSNIKFHLPNYQLTKTSLQIPPCMLKPNKNSYPCELLIYSMKNLQPRRREDGAHGPMIYEPTNQPTYHRHSMITIDLTPSTTEYSRRQLIPSLQAAS